MGLVLRKLTDRAIKAAEQGRHGDGDGLFLEVSAKGAKSWLLRFQLAGQRRDMGLGRYPEIGLADARRLAADARAKIARGVDPIDARKAAKQAARPVPLFKEVAETVVADETRKSSNAKVGYRWGLLLGEKYSAPLLNRRISEITASDIAKHLKPLWHEKPETASKYLDALRRLFEVARIRLRDEHGINFQNPATWADLRASGFESARKLTRGHHPSLRYSEMPAFMAALREQPGVAAMMLEFVILTCVRSGAARLARWNEFDLDQAVWTVPLSSLKDRKHRSENFRVPLSSCVVEILREAQSLRLAENDIVFPSPRGKVFTDMAMAAVLKRMNGNDRNNPLWRDPSDGRAITTHGFRATFKTWCEESMTFPHNVVEQALGHQIGTEVERAYRRTDVLEARRKLMDAWAQHCEPSQGSDNVLAFERKNA